MTNIESSFKRIRLMLAVFACCCALVTGYALWSSYRFAEKQREKIYVLDGGKSLMADKSAYHYYVDFAERGYYNRLISGNINQVVHVDSVVCDFAAYPYKVRTYARQLIIRESNVTERSLVTSCSLQNTGRSDDNPNGFIIEQFTVLENKDIRSAER